MATQVENPKLASNIQSLLAGLRWRIRSYVWVEGLAVAIAWIGVTFWTVLAIDYGPVLIGKWLGGLIPMLAGLPEASIPVRATLLAIIILSSLFIVYRWILRRAFVPMADHSMAVLLERRFGEFHDSLLTAVEMAERPDHAHEFNRAMLAHTNEDALSHVGHVRLRQIFNFSPLKLSAAAAAFFFATAAVAFFFWPDFGLAASRIYLLNSEPWPRSARVEVLGIEVQRSTPGGGNELPKMIRFGAGPVKVAKGSSVILKVQSDAKLRIPDVCTIIYENEEGDHGRQNMKKIGRVREGYQHYSFDGRPFKGILSSLHFDVVGFDHRVGQYRIEVVDNPSVVLIEVLDRKLPKYLQDAKSKISGKQARRDKVTWTSGMAVPRGTSFKVGIHANKPLESATIHFPKTDRTLTIEMQKYLKQAKSQDANYFEFDIATMQGDLLAEITLHDQDGVIADTPQRMFITSTRDEPPTVAVHLRGIGTAVTPEVIIPFEGKVSDDYEIAKVWAEIQAPDIELREHPIEVPKNGEVSASIDFREMRDDETKGFALTPGEQNKLILNIKASDYFDLAEEENIGSSDRYELDIVTADQLLTILDREEAGQRRRVEQIFREMTDARDWLLRVKADSLGGEDLGAEPEDKSTAEPEADDDSEKARRAAERLHSLRLLFSQRSLLQTRKSAQEVLGVAATFRDIREQLINNRIDAEDRKTRLKEAIADPLQRIGEEMFVDLELQIESLETKLKKLERDLDNERAIGDADEAADGAIEQAEYLLAELEKVLEHLIKFESYAELLEIVRGLIDDQEEVADETVIENEKDLYKLLDD